jgi:hypothetical protein
MEHDKKKGKEEAERKHEAQLLAPKLQPPKTHDDGSRMPSFSFCPLAVLVFFDPFLVVFPMLIVRWKNSIDEMYCESLITGQRNYILNKYFDATSVMY